MEEETKAFSSPAATAIEPPSTNNTPEEEPSSVWDELGGLDPDSLLMPAPSTSMYSDTSDPANHSAQDPWNWLRPPPVAPSFQVRLDGEPASTLTTTESIDLDSFLYPPSSASTHAPKSEPIPVSTPSSAISKPKLHEKSSTSDKQTEKTVKTEATLPSTHQPTADANTSSTTQKEQQKQPSSPKSQPKPVQLHTIPSQPKQEPQPVVQPPSVLSKRPLDADSEQAAVKSPTKKLKSEPSPLSPSVSNNIPSVDSTQPSVSKPPLPKTMSPPSSLKEKRAREARQFPKEILGSLDGTTSAEVRKMNATQRELVLYKRKLRNRESARRSRQKRQATLAELQDEIDDLMQVSERMVELGISLREENNQLRKRLYDTVEQLETVRSAYDDVVNNNHPANIKIPAEEDPAVALQMKLGG